MASQALYRRWRPQTFAEVIGQEHVTRTLQNALADGRVSHAYLFAGPRGTGKTSVARILAKAVNCTSDGAEKPCNRCLICLSLTEGRSLDLIEIDAASNRGIDEIRDLREKVHFAPSEARYKLYIVDEAHMLTNEAFNALLKTLEEPPPHVIFVLATTEPHKIPATILSRCQRFDFHRITLQDLLSKLRRICQEEGIAIEPAALELIARSATGSFRDAESLLDQLVAFADEEITLAQVQALLGTVPSQAVEELVDHILDGDVAAGLRLINQAVDDGMDPRQLNRQLLEHLRGLLLIRTGGGDSLLNVTEEQLARMKAQARKLPTQRLVQTIKLFNEAGLNMKIGFQPQLPLELALVEATLMGAQEERARAAPPRPASPVQKRGALTPSERPRRTPPVRETPAIPEVESKASASLEQVRDRWPQVLAAIKPHSRNVEALLKSCEPIAVEGSTVTLGFYYTFHKEKIEEPQHAALVERVLSQVLGAPHRIKCTLSPRDQRRVKKEKRPKTKHEVVAEDPLIRAAVEKYGAHIADVQTPPSG
ncbi:MAG TPA: DNA polymerase III subunit gamma/tau [Anaerolineae bacterium]|nr:DNA polymerase III subunit gamma/tau [Anaerolineae bacterium]